jgi:hypothetical protein
MDYEAQLLDWGYALSNKWHDDTTIWLCKRGNGKWNPYCGEGTSVCSCSIATNRSSVLHIAMQIGHMHHIALHLCIKWIHPFSWLPSFFWACAVNATNKKAHVAGVHPQFQRTVTSISEWKACIGLCVGYRILIPYKCMHHVQTNWCMYLSGETIQSFGLEIAPYTHLKGWWWCFGTPSFR